jgi:hypothetical protein
VLLLPARKIEHLIYFVKTATVPSYRLSAIGYQTRVRSRQSEVVSKTARRPDNVVTTPRLGLYIFVIFVTFVTFSSMRRFGCSA